MHSVILYFGSFNPVHKGHMAVAEWILEQGLCNEVWFVVSPQNPLKRDGSAKRSGWPWYGLRRQHRVIRGE